ncbi:transposase (plasmid) [Streptomyces sp. CA-294286]|uniref:transposase n=1 Tax=Streptomyces sp. CA-294286 TaxID=3240070 RepID=UPI003D8C28EE
MLSQLMRMPLPALVTPRVPGVDDFALYGDTYGTLLVDATTRLPLTLWEGRDAEQLGRWLRQHPGVEVVCRDGSLAYRQGITFGAPDALQVGDCFHLWQGLSRQVQKITSAHHDCLPAALPEPEPALAGARMAPAAPETPADRHARRLFEAVHTVADTGRSISSVSRELGLDRKTVRSYARARTWQEVARRLPRRTTTLDPYLNYLQQRWDEGEHSAKTLHEELLVKGYPGHYQRVKMAVAPLRRGLPLDEPRERPPSPREAARWIISTPTIAPHTAQRLQRLLDHCPELQQTHHLVRQFAAMLASRDAAPQTQWLDRLTTSGLSPLGGMAEALRVGQHAVIQGITHPLQLGRQRRPHHRCQAAEAPHGRTRRRRPPPPPRRTDRPPTPPIRGSADPQPEMISGYENLARATFSSTPTDLAEAAHIPLVIGEGGRPRARGASAGQAPASASCPMTTSAALSTRAERLGPG